MTVPLSHDEPERTLPSDTHEGGHDGAHAPDESPLRELLDGDAEQRREAPVPGVWAQERDEQGGRRVHALDSVPVVRLAHGAEGDVAEGLKIRRFGWRLWFRVGGRWRGTL